MSMVFVLDTNKKPLQPCHPARARQLLRDRNAAVFRRYPFTIILKRAVHNPGTSSLRLKIDPGSKTTGLAVVNDKSGKVVFAAELHHRGQQIRNRLLARRQLRRSRRNRKTRYRPPRFNNRSRPKGWLPPSLKSRVDNVDTWVQRLRRYAPVIALSMELARFDTQKLQNAEISGVEYQQGELHGYEVRQYLLQKFGHKCAYCGQGGVPLEVEHLVPKSRGGSDRVSNLAIACVGCNREKGRRTVAEYGVLKNKDFGHVAQQAKDPLKDAAAINSTRWALYKRLKQTGLQLEVGSGGQTKYNRTNLGLPKRHWVDAACVGGSTPLSLDVSNVKPLTIKAVGHGHRQMCNTDRFGFPRSHRRRQRDSFGFWTGDIVRAEVPRGKYAGVHVGRIAIRERPSFKLNGFDVHPKYLIKLHRSDGYEYTADSPHD